MICRECGAKIEDGALECKFCGAVYGTEEPQEIAEPVVEETYGIAPAEDEIEELFDENEAKRRVQMEKIREEKQAQLEEIEKRRKIKKRKQRRNRILVVLLILLCGVAIAAGVVYVGNPFSGDDEDHAVIVTPEATEVTDEPVWTPVVTEDPEESPTPEPTETPYPAEETSVPEDEELTDPTANPVVSYATEKPVVTQKPVATKKPVATQRPVTVNPVKKKTLNSAVITGGEVIKDGGNTYMSFLYNNKWYYAKVSANTTTKFIAWKKMTVNAYNKGETYKGVPVYTITKITHHDSTPQSSTPQSNVPQQSGSYIFPNSASQLLTTADLQGKTAYQLRIARNEIYARHGRTFKDSSLQNYFNSCSWYKVNSSYNYSNDNANLNDVEKKNITIIKNYESGL